MRLIINYEMTKFGIYAWKVFENFMSQDFFALKYLKVITMQIK